MGKTPRILCVDDDKEFTEMLETVLRLGGFDVQAAYSGKFALQTLESSDFDLVITDLSMPGMDGIQFIRRVRELKPTQRIVVVTGFPSQRTQHQASKLGTLYYLVKPIHPHRLIEVVKEALEESEDGLVGSVRFACEELIQLYSWGQKSVVLEIYSNGDVGRIYLKDGVPIHAATGELEGEEAFYEILGWRSGVFLVKRLDENLTRTIKRCTDALLIEGARRRDECQGCSSPRCIRERKESFIA